MSEEAVVVGAPSESVTTGLPGGVAEVKGFLSKSGAEPSLARSAQVLELGVPAGATSLQHLPHERSHDEPTEEQAPAAATAAHEA